MIEDVLHLTTSPDFHGKYTTHNFIIINYLYSEFVRAR